MKYRLIAIFCAVVVIFLNACQEPEPPKPLPIPTPLFEVSKTLIDLGDIKSSSKAQFKVKKNGIGQITFKISSNKSWVKIDNPDGNIGFLSDTVAFHVGLPASDLIDGENTAILTVTPTINGTVATPVLVEIKGNFKTTSMKANLSSIDFGTIKSTTKAKFVLSKTGLETVSYEAIADKPWIVLNRVSGILNAPDTVEVTINPSTFLAGNFGGKITISPKILGSLATPIVINVSGIYDDTITGNVSEHSLSKDETWGGTIYLNGSVIVPKALKLTIKPGTIIYVKKLSSLITLTIYGKLIMNGDIANIIEMKSAETVISNSDWGAIFSNGDIEMSYVLLKNARNGINFENFNTFSGISQKIHHVLFDNNYIGIYDYKSNIESTLNNLTFRNIEKFGFRIAESKKTNIEACEFLDAKCYIDIHIVSNNGLINIKNSNFMKKDFGYLSQLEVSDGSKFNTIFGSNCYSIVTKNGIGINANVYFGTNELSSPNQNIGCGFVSKYASARKRI